MSAPPYLQSKRSSVQLTSDSWCRLCFDLHIGELSPLQPCHLSDLWQNLTWPLFLPRVFVAARLRNITWLTWWLADCCCLLAALPIWPNCLGTSSAETDEEIGLRRSISRLSLKSAAPRGVTCSKWGSSRQNQWWNVAHIHNHNLL